MTSFDSSRFAVIADIHSNADALSAVLGDIAAQKITSIVNLGDHVSGPIAPRETAEILMAQEAMISVRGNHDRWVTELAREDMYSIDRVAFDQLEPLHLDWLRALQPTAWLGEDIFACHGTPASDTTYWTETVTETGEVVLRDREGIIDDAHDVAASLYLCGHTHLPRRVDLGDGRIVLNPGSVGCPGYSDDAPLPHVVQTGTPDACYAIVERTKAGWASAFRHVPYDPTRMIACAKAADHGNWAARLATGWVR